MTGAALRRPERHKSTKPSLAAGASVRKRPQQEASLGGRKAHGRSEWITLLSILVSPKVLRGKRDERLKGRNPAGPGQEVQSDQLAACESATNSFWLLRVALDLSTRALE